jgi:hypothetical protein
LANHSLTIAGIDGEGFVILTEKTPNDRFRKPVVNANFNQIAQISCFGITGFK